MALDVPMSWKFYVALMLGPSFSSAWRLLMQLKLLPLLLPARFRQVINLTYFSDWKPPYIYYKVGDGPQAGKYRLSQGGACCMARVYGVQHHYSRCCVGTSWGTVS